jgi:leucyl aminopeptidase
MYYAQRQYKPAMMIDLATLTGAITVALGDIYAGLFSNSEILAKNLIESGKKTGELVWQMPMGEAYDKQIDSAVADVRNTSMYSRGAGSTTAAQFLYRFVKEADKDNELEANGGKLIGASCSTEVDTSSVASITAKKTNACPEKCEWAHLDIAGVAFNKFGNPTSPKGASGFGVRLLDKFILDFIENKR